MKSEGDWSDWTIVPTSVVVAMVVSLSVLLIGLFCFRLAYLSGWHQGLQDAARSRWQAELQETSTGTYEWRAVQLAKE